MELSNQSTELTIPAVEEYLKQLEVWDKQVIPQIKNERGILPRNWSILLRDGLIGVAQRENPRLVPLVNARFGADLTITPQDLEAKPVGQPMSGEDLDVTGHTSLSTLCLINEKANTMQTMVRLLVEGDRGRELVDVYSSPIHPGFIKVEGEDYSNINATEPSRALNLLQHIEANKLQVLGWVPIPEIPAQQVPSYTTPSVNSGE